MVGFGETENVGIATTIMEIKNEGETGGSKGKQIFILRGILLKQLKPLNWVPSDRFFSSPLTHPAKNKEVH